MNIVRELLNVISQNNLILITNMQMVLFIYLFIFIILFLENAILIAFFLPGDSLLIILGVFVAKGVLNFFITLGILTVAVSLGSWVSYLQGKFFKNKKILRTCLSYFPSRSYQRAIYMFNKHGLLALFFGRFIAFIRTVLPMIAGISGLNSIRFQLFNWISSFIWVLMLIIVGFFLDYFGNFCFI